MFKMVRHQTDTASLSPLFPPRFAQELQDKANENNSKAISREFRKLKSKFLEVLDRLCDGQSDDIKEAASDEVIKILQSSENSLKQSIKYRLAQNLSLYQRASRTDSWVEKHMPAQDYSGIQNLPVSSSQPKREAASKGLRIVLMRPAEADLSHQRAKRQRCVDLDSVSSDDITGGVFLHINNDAIDGIINGAILDDPIGDTIEDVIRDAMSDTTDGVIDAGQQDDGQPDIPSEHTDSEGPPENAVDSALTKRQLQVSVVPLSATRNALARRSSITVVQRYVPDTASLEAVLKRKRQDNQRRRNQNYKRNCKARMH